MATSSGDDFVLSQLQSPISQIFSSFLSSSVTIDKDVPTLAPSATDTLEIALRRRCVDLLQSFMALASPDESRTQALTEIVLFWKDTLRAIQFIIQTVERNGESKCAEDKPSHEFIMGGIDAVQRENIFPHTTFLRRLSIVLLDDILDTLPSSSASSFWETTVPGSLLFSQTLWEFPSQHPCWLPFLKTSNKFMRKLQPECWIESSDLSSASPQTSISAAFDVLALLSTVYPLSEKSATRTWGSHNADHWTVFESAIEFDTDVAEMTTASDLSLDTSPHHNFSFYETFWKLQHDFRNLNRIVVAEFLQRLKSVLNCLKSFPLAIPVDSSIHDQELIVLPYLTHSRLLPIQLKDPGMRTILLTQVAVVARHLMSQVPLLRTQLQAHLTTAESLFPDVSGSFRINRILGRSEEQWRLWKQKKFTPDLESPREHAIPSTESLGKRKRFMGQNELVSSVTFDWMGVDLANVVKKMKSTAPSLRDHLVNYVEALDPESGIEAEYHPKNDSTFCWRALRLLAASEHLVDFGLIYPNGDFESIVRHIYTEDFGVVIPGEGVGPYFEDGESDEANCSLGVTAAQNTDSLAEHLPNDKIYDQQVAHNDMVDIGDVDSVQTDAATEDVEMVDTNQDDGLNQVKDDQGVGLTAEILMPNSKSEPMSDEQGNDLLSPVSATDVSVSSFKTEAQKPDIQNQTAAKEQHNGLDHGKERVTTVVSAQVSAKRAISSGSEGRLREGTIRARPDSGHMREPLPRHDLGRRETKDYGDSARRFEPPRDGQVWNDDRSRGNNENTRRDDRRVGQNEGRRDDRRDVEPRRDDRRGNRDTGKERFDRGRSEYENDRRGGRSNSGRR